MDERTLIRQCKKGKRAAQRRLYEKYRSRWFTITLRYTRDRQDALDVLQNGLVKIFLNLGTFDDKRGHFSSWSSKIMVNECLMFIRKGHSRDTMMNGYHSIQNDQGIESAVERLTAEEIIRLINQLPDGYRAIFNLYAIEGYTHSEISEKLGISVGTSKSQLFKARKMLQTHIHNLFEIANP